MSAKPFIERIPQLLAIEGWYDVHSKAVPKDRDTLTYVQGYRFKLSCRFKDMLRCSEFNGKTTHFYSCFGAYGVHREQPLRRCYDPTWAIAYTPDKHGNFMGRAWIQWKDGQLYIGRGYGNRLTGDDIKLEMMTNNSINCQVGVPDTYLEMRA